MQCDLEHRYEVGKTEDKDGFLAELKTIGGRYHIGEILPLSTSDICVAQWVRLKCKYGCRRYGTSWCCPPETPTPEQVRALLEEYQTALLLCGRSQNGHFYRDNQKKRRIQVSAWKGTVALERHLFLSGYYKAFGLVSESCPLCKVCAYPDECKFPMDRRPSVESCSIDIFQTLKNLGKSFTIAHSVTEEFYYYSIILLQ